MSTPQPIPFLDLVTPHRELEEELVEAFRDALRSAQFIGGPEVEAFEQEFAEYCGAKHCVGVSNGTDAVRFALMAAVLATAMLWSPSRTRLSRLSRPSARPGRRRSSWTSTNGLTT